MDMELRAGNTYDLGILMRGEEQYFVVILSLLYRNCRSVRNTAASQLMHFLALELGDMDIRTDVKI